MKFIFYRASVLSIRTALLVICVSFFSYLLLHGIAGSAHDALRGIDAPAHYEEQEEERTFTSLVVDYGSWLQRAVQFDFGTSFLTAEPIKTTILARWKTTVLLAVLSFSMALLSALLLVRVLDTGSPLLRRFLHGGVLTLMAFTPFTLSLYALLVVRFLPFPFPVFYGQSLTRYILPVVVLTLGQIPLYVQSLLSSVMLVKKSSFVTFAFTLGFSSRWVWWREIVPSAFLFTLGVAAVQLGYLLTGTLIIETMFSLSGLGSLLLHSVIARDIEVVQAIVVLTAFIVAFIKAASEFVAEFFTAR